MAMIGRKQSVATTDNTRMGRLRGTIQDIMAELRKVTWPTREETRKLTIVVIGISVALGAFLGGLDMILSYLYRLINP
jgi:preprotein translocase subunit SecE